MGGPENKVRHYSQRDSRQFPGQHQISWLSSVAVPFRCYEIKVKELCCFNREHLLFSFQQKFLTLEIAVPPLFPHLHETVFRIHSCSVFLLFLLSLIMFDWSRDVEVTQLEFCSQIILT